MRQRYLQRTQDGDRRGPEVAEDASTLARGYDNRMQNQGARWWWVSIKILKRTRLRCKRAIVADTIKR